MSERYTYSECPWCNQPCCHGDCQEEETCGKPCPPHDPCDECRDYWDRMKKEGFWIDGKGWTEKATREMSK